MSMCWRKAEFVKERCSRKMIGWRECETVESEPGECGVLMRGAVRTRVHDWVGALGRIAPL